MIESNLIQDWEVAKAIYQDAVTDLQQEHDESSQSGTIRLSINTDYVAFFATSTPTVFYYILNPLLPHIIVSFSFKDILEDFYSLQSVKLDTDPTKYCPRREQWLHWMSTRIEKDVSNQTIFSICDFILSESLHFFGDSNFVVLDSDSPELDVIEFPSNRLQSLLDWKEKDDDVDLFVFDVTECDLEALQGPQDDPHLAVQAFLLPKARMTCPICLDPLPILDMEKMTCGHFLCKDCVSCYIQGGLKSLPTMRHTPFVCVLPECRMEMDLKTCLAKFITEQEIRDIETWKIEVENAIEKPPAITICPRIKCQSTIMKRVEKTYENQGRDSMIYCDTCGFTWCETCLAKIIDGEHNICNDSYVNGICLSYRDATEERRTQVDARYPFLKSYVSWKLDEARASDWCKSNASICPTCGMGIEKTQGCLHMMCPECGTHFCYKCGKAFELSTIYQHKCINSRFEWDDMGFMF